ALDADVHLRAVPLRKLVRAAPMPRVRQDDCDRAAEALDVAVERNEEPVLLPARHERVDEAHALRRLDVGRADLAVVPLGMPRGPAPEARLQLLHVQTGEPPDERW